MNRTQSIEKSLFWALHQALQTPVSQIKKQLDGLAQEGVAAPHVAALRASIESIEHASNKTKLLLELREGTFTPHMDNFIGIDFFERLIAPYYVPFSDAKLQFFVYIDPNMPKHLRFDCGVLHHLLTQLLDNALKFCAPQSSVYIDIRSKSIDKERVQLLVSVTDTGPGMDKEQLKKIISLQALQEETGMGLVTAFYLLKHLGSELKIATERGKGSRFSFALEALTDHEPYFHIVPELRIGIYTDDRTLFGYAKLLYQYIISIGVSIVSIKNLDDAEAISHCNALLIIGSALKEPLQKVQKKHPKTLVMPALLREDKTADAFETFLGLPVVPTELFALLEKVEAHLPSEVIEASVKEQEALTQLAQKAHKDPYKILVVEDNLINLKLVQVVLKRYDFIVDVAENGQTAVDKCQTNSYDLILMDIDMPVMDGITATKLIKAYQEREGIVPTPIVALTSHDLIGEREEIIAQGLDEHMPKPLNISRLELMLERYLGYTYAHD